MAFFVAEGQILATIQAQQLVDGAALAAIQAQQVVDGTALAAIQVQHGAALAAMQAQQVQDGAALAAIQVQLTNIAAALGAAGTTPQRIAIAKSCNKHEDDSRVFVVVPTNAGATPPNWPVGFDIPMLRAMNTAAVNALLGDYGLHVVGCLSIKRRGLARHIGAAGF